jgi:hypothetical protein
MSEKFPILAENISAMTPLDESTHAILDNYGVDEQRRQQYADKFAEFTAEQLNRVELAIALSRPQALEPIVGVHDEVSISSSYNGFNPRELGISEECINPKTLHQEARDYESVRHDPEKKLKRDSDLVLSFLRGVGTTNPLRTPEGFDAVFELGRMRHLLERDYESVVQNVSGQEKAQRPELRFVEALVAEQMALLWTPTAMGSANEAPEDVRDMIANPSDTNLFSEEQLSQLTDQQRWILVGARQCYEAADLFKAIYSSDSVSGQVKQQALDRWADMYIRGKLLDRAVATSPEEKLKLQEQVRHMALVHNHKAHEFRNNTLKNRQVNAFNAQKLGREYIPTEEEIDLSGAAFESVVIATERAKLIQKGIYNQVVRLSMPGEDQIEKTIKPLIVNGSLKINLSSDIIIEHLNGKKLGGLQAKAMPAEVYETLEQRKTEKTGLATEYPSEITAMRFTDSVGYK